MAERESRAPEDLVREHVRVFERLAHGPELFERTARIDFGLVEKSRTDLADELAVLEERMAAAARKAGESAGKPGGVGKLLEASPELREALEGLLGRALEALGRPDPGRFEEGPRVAPNVFLTPTRSSDFPLLRKGRIEPSRN